MVTVTGDCDVHVAAELGRTVAKLQRASTVFVDLWDVSSLDPVALGMLEAASRRARATQWGFAVIAPPGGLAATAIEVAGLQDDLPVFATKAEAVAARHRT